MIYLFIYLFKTLLTLSWYLYRLYLDQNEFSSFDWCVNCAENETWCVFHTPIWLHKYVSTIIWLHAISWPLDQVEQPNRGRGKMSRDFLNAILNKWVFRLILNFSSESINWMSVGEAFHVSGAAALKALPPILVLVGYVWCSIGTCRWSVQRKHNTMWKRVKVWMWIK